MRCCAATRRWSTTCRRCSRRAACGVIAAASRVTSPWKRTGSRVGRQGSVAMNDNEPKVQRITPGEAVMTMQRLPYFIGISGRTVKSKGLSMHLVVIPPGARAEPHRHIGYETGIYVLEGTVRTRWGENLEHDVVRDRKSVV